MTVYKKAARTHTWTHTLAHQAILIPIGIHQTTWVCADVYSLLSADFLSF